MRTNILLDEGLVQEAFRLTDARTKRELVQMALEELIRVRRKRNLAELAGRVHLTEDFDHKAMRDVRSDNR